MWIIPELGPMETRQDSKLDRFFDGQTKSQSLVRESIQNSLDAQIDSSEPVKIAFRFGQIDFEKLKIYLNGLNSNLISHLKACGKTVSDGKQVTWLLKILIQKAYQVQLTTWSSMRKEILLPVILLGFGGLKDYLIKDGEVVVVMEWVKSN